MLTRTKGKGNPHLLLVGLQHGVTTMGFSAENDEKAESSPTIKHKYSTPLHVPKTPDILYKYTTPSAYTQRTYILLKYSNSFTYPPKTWYSTTKTCFVATLLTITRKRKQPECPLTDECVMKMSYTVEFYSAAKEKRNLATSRWLDRTGKH